MKTLVLVVSHFLVAGIAATAAYLYLPERDYQPYSGPTITVNERGQVMVAPPGQAPAPLPPPIYSDTAVSINAEDSIFSQQYAAHQLAAQSDEQALIALMDQYLAARDPFMHGNLALIFLERLVELDVLAALDYVESARVPANKQQILHSSLLTTWARYDPAAMAEYFAGMTNLQMKYQTGLRLLQDPVFRASGHEQQVIAALGQYGEQILQQVEQQQKPPEQLFSEALANQGLRRQNDLRQALASWYQIDPEAALAAMNQLDETDLRVAVPSIAHLASRQDPFVAYDLAQRYRPDDQQLLGTTIAMMMANDPDQGLVYLEQHFDESGNIGFLNQVIMSWANSDVDAALAYLATQPEHIRSSIEPSLAMSMSMQNPRAAIAWAVESGNRQIQISVASNLSHRDPAAAENWLRTAEDPQVISVLLRGVAEQKTQLGLNQAISWLGEFEESPGYAQAMNTVISTYAQADPEASSRYLRQHADNNDYGSAFVQVATIWGYSDVDAAQQWVASLPAGANKDTAARSVLQGVIATKPDEALAMIDDLGSPADTQDLRWSLASQMYMRTGDLEESINKAQLNGEMAARLRQDLQGRGRSFLNAPSTRVMGTITN